MDKDIKKQKEVILGNNKFLIINLMHPIGEDVEVYPGDPKPSKKLFTDIEKTGYHHYLWRIGDHHFHPHGDAPSHQNIELQDKTFDSFDMDYFFNNAIMIDLSEADEAKEFQGIKFLTKIELRHIEQIKDKLSDKGALVIRTGYDRWLLKNIKHDPEKIPYLTKEAADFIAGFGNLKVIALDSLTVDPIDSHYAHQKFKKKLIVESLVNLHDIPKESRNNFDLQTSTIALKGATGGPISAFAYIKI